MARAISGRTTVSIICAVAAPGISLAYGVLEASGILASGLAQFGYATILSASVLATSLVPGLRRRLSWINVVAALAACVALFALGFVTFFEAGYIVMFVAVLAAVALFVSRA